MSLFFDAAVPKRMAAAVAFATLLTACNGLSPTVDSPGSPGAPESTTTTVAAPTTVESTTTTVAPTTTEAPTTTVAPTTTEAPTTTAPAPPPVEMQNPNNLVPKTPPPAPAPAPAPNPAAPAGFSPLDLQLNFAPGNQRLQEYAVGINACAGLLEAIMIRDDSAGDSKHIVDLGARELGGNAAGVASSPRDLFSYNQLRLRGLSLDLDDDLGNQFGVCNIFIHEALHTFAVAHTGSQIMSPVIGPDRLSIDRPVLVELNKVGYRFIGPVQQQLEQGQSVPIATLLASYTNTTAQQLQAQQT